MPSQKIGIAKPIMRDQSAPISRQLLELNDRTALDPIAGSRLRRMTRALLFFVMGVLVIVMALYMTQAWKNQKKQINTYLSSLAHLTRIATQNHLVALQQDYNILASDIQRNNFLDNPTQMRQSVLDMMQHVKSLAILNIVAPDGTILVSSALPVRGPHPNVNSDPNLRALLKHLREHPDACQLWHPIQSLLLHRLVMHIGLAVTDKKGRILFYLLGGTSLDGEMARYKSLIPVHGAGDISSKIRLGVIDANGYLFGAWTVPHKNGKSFFEQPRTGIVHQTIAKSQDLSHGQFEGYTNAGPPGMIYMGAYERMPDSHLSAFALLPKSFLIAGYWKTVRIPLALAASLALLVVAAFAWTSRLQRQWVARTHSTLRQITQARDKQERAAKEFSAIFNDLPTGVVVLNTEGRVHYCSERFVDMLKIDRLPHTMIGLAWRDVWNLIKHHWPAPEVELQKIKGLFEQEGDDHIEIDLADGRVLSCHYQALKTPDQEQFRMLGLQDITEQKHSERKIRMLAETDALTALANRRAFERNLEHECCSGRVIAVGIIDLDDFKDVNDTYGHATGDDLLKQVAVRLSSVFRTDPGRAGADRGDILARIGGDEFAVLLTRHATAHEVLQIGQRVVDKLREPFQVGDIRIFARTSIGMALGEGVCDAQSMMRQADIALYEAKNGGRSQVRLYDASMEDSIRHRNAWMAIVREALMDGRLELYMQPILAISEGQDGFKASVRKVEALLRLRDQDGQIHTAGEFEHVLNIPALAASVGRFVLVSAATWALQWLEQGHRLTLAVNIAEQHFLSRDFMEDLEHVLRTHPDLPADCLEIELTEHGSALPYALMHQRIQECRALGIQVQLDDFGTGNASFTHLQGLAIAGIKIDRSFIEGMRSSTQKMALVLGLLKTSEYTGIEAVCEGVETQELANILISLGFRRLQGYGLAYPMPANALIPWIREISNHASWLAWLPATGASTHSVQDLMMAFAMMHNRIANDYFESGRDIVMRAGEDEDANIRRQLIAQCEALGSDMNDAQAMMHLVQSIDNWYGAIDDYLTKGRYSATVERTIAELAGLVLQNLMRLGSGKQQPS